MSKYWLGSNPDSTLTSEQCTALAQLARTIISAPASKTLASTATASGLGIICTCISDNKGFVKITVKQTGATTLVNRYILLFSS